METGGGVGNLMVALLLEGYHIAYIGHLSFPTLYQSTNIHAKLILLVMKQVSV